MDTLLDSIKADDSGITLVGYASGFERQGAADAEKLEEAVKKVFDLRPTAIIRDLDLRKPIYRQLAAYGHMGREDLGVKWENTDRVDALKAAVAAL